MKSTANVNKSTPPSLWKEAAYCKYRNVQKPAVQQTVCMKWILSTYTLSEVNQDSQSYCFLIVLISWYKSSILPVFYIWKKTENLSFFMWNYFFHTSHLKIEIPTLTLLLFQFMELKVIIVGRCSLRLRVKDTEILSLVCQNTADCSQASIFLHSNFGTTKVPPLPFSLFFPNF